MQYIELKKEFCLALRIFHSMNCFDQVNSSEDFFSDPRPPARKVKICKETHGTLFNIIFTADAWIIACLSVFNYFWVYNLFSVVIKPLAITIQKIMYRIEVMDLNQVLWICWKSNYLS